MDGPRDEGLVANFYSNLFREIEACFVVPF